MLTKRVTLTGFLLWIAENDEVDCTDIQEVSELLSVCMIADMYDKDRIDLAKKIVSYRKTQNLKNYI